MTDGKTYYHKLPISFWKYKELIMYYFTHSEHWIKRKCLIVSSKYLNIVSLALINIDDIHDGLHKTWKHTNNGI